MYENSRVGGSVPPLATILPLRTYDSQLGFAQAAEVAGYVNV